MNAIFNKVWKPAVAAMALAGSLIVADAAQAGHYRQPRVHPAAEAHMKTAIRLMTIACDKPFHVSKSLARAAVTHISLAQRFARTPGAQAELCGAKAHLERFVYGHCAPPFHPAIQQTRLALDLERSPCVCGRASCRGGCHAPPPVHPGFTNGRRVPAGPGFTNGRRVPAGPGINGRVNLPPGPGFNGRVNSPAVPEYTHELGQRFGRGYAGRDFQHGYGQNTPGLNSVAARWGQTRYGH